VVLDPTAAAILNEHGPICWQLPIGSAEQLVPGFEQLLSHRLSAIYEPLMFWWTDGSSIVEPCCLIASGLPHPDCFAALLDGSWKQYGWQSVPAQVQTGFLGNPLVDETAPLHFRSAAASDVGRVRETNEDAFLERPESGIWAVADGLGGHRDGEIASRMVCDALSSLGPCASFDEAIEAAQGRLREVNDHLLRTAARSLVGERSGSTVVALLVRGTRCAVLWAGDSRVYRWRTGRLERLTHDHSSAESGRAAGRVESSSVTRAVGVHPTLTLDVLQDRVCAGDRFLLCSDGLTRMLPEAGIRLWMESPEIQVAVDGLIKATLDAGAPDNVTVLIAEACA
jgi:type VI secretion system protein ImpM